MNRNALRLGAEYAVDLRRSAFQQRINIDTGGLVRARVLGIKPLIVEVVAEDVTEKAYVDGAYVTRPVPVGEKRQLSSASRIAAPWAEYEAHHRDKVEKALAVKALHDDRSARLDRIVALLEANGFVAADRTPGPDRTDLYQGADFARGHAFGPNRVTLEFTVDALERLIHGDARQLDAARKAVGA